MKYCQSLIFAFGLGCVACGIGALDSYLWVAVPCLILGSALAGLWIHRRTQEKHQHQQVVEGLIKTQTTALEQMSSTQIAKMEEVKANNEKYQISQAKQLANILMQMDSMSKFLLMALDQCTDGLDKQQETLTNLCENLEETSVSTNQAVKNSIRTILSQTEEQQIKLCNTMTVLGSQYEAFQAVSESMVAQMTLMSKEDQDVLRKIMEGQFHD